MTLGDQFAARKTNGFDYLRITLAVAVVAWHSITASFGQQPGDDLVHGTLWVPIVRSIMPIFFGLSGFLVASSLERTARLTPFLTARALRIFPALLVEVILSALVLGPLLTSDTIGKYVANRQFLSYFANVLGWVHFLLPGVFLTNPDAGIVNRSLWTVPSELECYILLSLLFALGLFRRPKLFVLLTIGYAVVATALIDTEAFSRAIVVWPRLLPLAFLAGVMGWIWRDRLPAGGIWGVGALVLTVVLMANVRTTAIACLPAAYVAATLGCVEVPRNRLLASGDYSYGLYLYAYPIQQLIVSIVGPQRPVVTFLAAMVFIPAFAAFSWHAVEKHALKLKSRLIARRKEPAVPDHEPQQSGRPAESG